MASDGWNNTGANERRWQGWGTANDLVINPVTGRPRSWQPASEKPRARAVLTVLIGAAGSGKSTAAAAGWPPGQVLSSDEMRRLVSGNPNDQGATAEAMAALHLILRARLRRGLDTVVDATHSDPAARAAVLGIACETDAVAVAVAMDTPLRVCLARNATRPGPPAGARWGRRVPEEAVRKQHREIQDSLPGLLGEGFSQVRTWRSAFAL